MNEATLEQILAKYSQSYSLFNQNPEIWEAQYGAWPEYEHLEKSRVLFEMGRIMELLYLTTRNEGALNTGGDLEYYSTVREALEEVRIFLEKNITEKP
ncbi:MAG: hypothetical protein WCA07_11315 [Gloeobacterales cyanobacterium]